MFFKMAGAKLVRKVVRAAELGKRRFVQLFAESHRLQNSGSSFSIAKLLNLFGTNGRVSETKGTHMKNALLILLILTPALFANKKPKRNVAIWDSSPTGIRHDVNGHMQVEDSGIVTLTKKGQRASYNVVGASEKGTLLFSYNVVGASAEGTFLLGLDTKAEEGAFKVQLAKGAKIKLIEPSDDEEGKALIDVNEHLIVEHTSITTDVDGYLQVENSGIVTVWAESWPPPKTENDNEANVLIVKTLNSGISSGKIRLKKPPLTLEQRAE
ncbi:MAG: hypothetical protein ACON5G_17370 [Pirellulaceae bacterium]